MGNDMATGQQVDDATLATMCRIAQSNLDDVAFGLIPGRASAAQVCELADALTALAGLLRHRATRLD